MALLRRRANAHQIVRFEHVRGHSGILGNEGADALATAGAHLPILAERDWDKLRSDLEEGEKAGGPPQIMQLEFEVRRKGLTQSSILSPVRLFPFLY